MNSFFNFNDFQKQVYRLNVLKMNVNKMVLFGIISSGMIIGFLVILSFDLFSIMENKDASSEPILGDDGKESMNDQKPPGRNLSIEFDEKIGLSVP